MRIKLAKSVYIVVFSGEALVSKAYSAHRVGQMEKRRQRHPSQLALITECLSVLQHLKSRFEILLETRKIQ